MTYLTKMHISFLGTLRYNLPMNAKVHSMNMCEGALVPKIIKFTLPLIASDLPTGFLQSNAVKGGGAWS